MSEATAPSHLLALMTAVALADSEPREGDDEISPYRFKNRALRALLAERTEDKLLITSLRNDVQRLTEMMRAGMHAVQPLPPPPEPR